MSIFAKIYRKLKQLLLREKKPTFPGCTIGDHVCIAPRCGLQETVVERYVNLAHDVELLNSTVGERSSIGRYSKLRDTDVGRFCSISWDVSIGAVSHPMTRATSHAFTYRSQFGLASEDLSLPQLRTTIGNDVWIGCNSVIISGVTVGNGAIIGAGAVVTKDVPPYSVVAGVPARFLRWRLPEEQCQRLNQLAWWNWDDETLKQHIHLFQHDLDKETLELLCNVNIGGLE